jgi:rod shape-determining protein MreC
VAVPASSGVARRRAVVRRGVIAALVIVCLAIFTGYFRESPGGPLHGVQSTAASVVSPVQEVATRAVQPLRDGWGWVSSLRDARDRAARYQAENETLRAAAADNAVRDQRLIDLEQALGVEKLIGRGGELGGYEAVTGLVSGRSISPWYRTARLDVGKDDGVVRNSPVVAGSERGSALVGLVTSVTGHYCVVSMILDGRTEVGATIPQAGNPQGLLQSNAPGQLSLTDVPRAAPVRLNQVVVTSGSYKVNLPSIYPPGIPVGQVTSVGKQEVDVQQTVQVTPYADPSDSQYLTVLTPQSAKARQRAAG